MEHKIGEIFEYNGEWYQCVTGRSCGDCAFRNDDCEERERITLREKLTKQPTTGFCNSEKRNDRKSVIFKKLEKVGEPYTHYCPSGRIIHFQRYKLFYKLYSHNTEYIMCDFNEDSIVSIEIKQNKEDMKEKKVMIGELAYKYINGKITYEAFEKGIRELYEKRSNSEKIGKNLKPFDLEAAKAGKPVCTRDGSKARIVCFDRKDNAPIIALIERVDGIEILQCYHNDGKCFHDETSNNDLMMLPEKKEGWVNLYKSSVRSTKEEAMKYRNKCNDYIDTIKIEWEE